MKTRDPMVEIEIRNENYPSKTIKLPRDGNLSIKMYDSDVFSDFILDMVEGIRGALEYEAPVSAAKLILMGMEIVTRLDKEIRGENPVGIKPFANRDDLHWMENYMPNPLACGLTIDRLGHLRNNLFHGGIPSASYISEEDRSGIIKDTVLFTIRNSSKAIAKNGFLEEDGYRVLYIDIHDFANEFISGLREWENWLSKGAGAFAIRRFSDLGIRPSMLITESGGQHKYRRAIHDSFVEILSSGGTINARQRQVLKSIRNRGVLSLEKDFGDVKKSYFLDRVLCGISAYHVDLDYTIEQIESVVNSNEIYDLIKSDWQDQEKDAKIGIYGLISNRRSSDYGLGISFNNDNGDVFVVFDITSKDERELCQIKLPNDKRMVVALDLF